MATVVTEWTIRHRTDVTAAMRVKYGNDFYYITGIRELGRREGLVLLTELRDNGTGAGVHG